MVREESVDMRAGNMRISDQPLNVQHEYQSEDPSGAAAWAGAAWRGSRAGEQSLAGMSYISGGHPIKRREPLTLKKVKSTIGTGIADFFGVGEEAANQSKRWQNRRLKHASRKYGRLKDEYIPQPKEGEDEVDSGYRVIHDPLHVGGFARSTSMYSRQSSRHPIRRDRKDSVMKMTWHGLSNVLGATHKLNKSTVHSRSFAPGSIHGEYDDYSLSGQPGYSRQQSQAESFSLVDDVFFDEPTIIVPGGPPLQKISEDVADIRSPAAAAASVTVPDASFMQPSAAGWRRRPPTALPDTPAPGKLDEPDFPDTVGMRRIAGNALNSAMEKPDHREIGMGLVGRLFNRSFKRDRLSSEVKGQLDGIDDHRPFFTYWVTFVQVVIFIVSVSVHGIGPIGVGESIDHATVLKPNLVLETEDYVTTRSFWLGPRQDSLIHLGAKYSPCMRKDTNVYVAIDMDFALERSSGCCILGDGSGCYQTIDQHCFENIATFNNGSVCGQDPDFCTNPQSIAPFEWDKDITKWPVCTETSKPPATAKHMTCELTGHPCCFGIQGECYITTPEHCEFIKGYYHEEAFLCSQVHCLSKICGMIPFANPEQPDQFYRLWTSLFLHGGVIHIIITIAFQMLIMRDVEKLAGVIRVGIIYITCGIAGNLASAIFLPYFAEVGPAGSQFGILACLLVEILQSWQMLKRPWFALLKIGGITLALFLIGLLPWVDNYAHLCGFIYGVLLAFALLPYVSFGTFDRKRKIIGIVISLVAAIGIFAILIVLFYVLPIYECAACQFFNCVPFTLDFCKDMEINISRVPSYTRLYN